MSRFPIPRLDEWLAFARREIGLIAAFLGVAFLLWAFVSIAASVSEGDTRAFDVGVANALHTNGHVDPIGPHWFEERVFELTALGSIMVVALVTVSAAGFLLVVRKYGAALLLLVAVIGGAGLSESLKLGIARARPDLIPINMDISGMSFPSGHATLAAVCYLTIAALLAHEQQKRRVKAYVIFAAVLVTLMVGLSRIYLGVHWATDVLGGWCLGAAWAILCWNVAYWLERRRGARQAEEQQN